MNKLVILSLIFSLLLLFIGIIFFAIAVSKPKLAGIFIESSPQSIVFLDNEEVGRTPYRGVRKPGEVTVRLVPESQEKILIPYETKINLLEGVETVVRRQFSDTEESSSVEILSFERAGKDEVSLVVVTIPDVSQLLVDNQIKAQTPYKISSISQGNHSLLISKEGFLQKNIQIKTYKGYKLLIVVKLAKTVQENQEEIEKNQETLSLVEILPTSTGFLRVRDNPSLSANEIGRVEVGKQYPLLDKDEQTGWFKIEFFLAEEEKKVGWISNQYARIITPTPTLSP